MMHVAAAKWRNSDRCWSIANTRRQQNVAAIGQYLSSASELQKTSCTLLQLSVDRTVRWTDVWTLNRFTVLITCVINSRNEGQLIRTGSNYTVLQKSYWSLWIDKLVCHRRAMPRCGRNVRRLHGYNTWLSSGSCTCLSCMFASSRRCWPTLLTALTSFLAFIVMPTPLRLLSSRLVGTLWAGATHKLLT